MDGVTSCTKSLLNTDDGDDGGQLLYVAFASNTFSFLIIMNRRLIYLPLTM